MSLMRGAAMRRKGEPVWVLVAIIGGWIGVRVATWDIMGGDFASDPAFARIVAPPALSHGPARAFVAPRPDPAAGHDRLPMPLLPPTPLVPEAPVRPVALREPGEGVVGMAGGHQLLWLAAVADMPLAYDLARRGAAAYAHARTRSPGGTLTVAVIDAEAHGEPPAVLAVPRAANWFVAPAAPVHAALPRWSGDAWLLWRRDGDSAGGGGGSLLLPSYGANQVGAVLRYRLAPASGYRPTAYARAYGALNGTGEREVAAGFSARPLPAVPITVMGEARASHFAGGTTHVRPAVTVVTELSPVMLPGAMRAETYVQAGYVGGTASTAFVDGQFRLEHIAAHSPHAEVRLGGGVWGGAQTGAGRMDVGPTATVAFSTAGAGAHVSVDWRFRVAGNAMPGSGPAVTLAAGF
jgi:hypothetical protein